MEFPEDFEAAMEQLVAEQPKQEFTEDEKLACSLANPEYCEACQ